MRERRAARHHLLRHLRGVLRRRHRIVRIHPAVDQQVRDHRHGDCGDAVHEFALVALQQAWHQEYQCARDCERVQLDAEDQREHAAEQPADAPAALPREDAGKRAGDARQHEDVHAGRLRVLDHLRQQRDGRRESDIPLRPQEAPPGDVAKIDRRDAASADGSRKAHSDSPKICTDAAMRYSSLRPRG